MKNGRVTISENDGSIHIDGFYMETYRNALDDSLDWAISQLLSKRFGGVTRLLFSNNFIQSIPSLVLACTTKDMVVLEDWGLNIDCANMPEFKRKKKLADMLRNKSYVKWWMSKRKRAEMMSKLQKEIRIADKTCAKVLLLAVYESEFLKTRAADKEKE